MIPASVTLLGSVFEQFFNQAVELGCEPPEAVALRLTELWAEFFSDLSLEGREEEKTG
jgi:hypothetical protein